MANKWMNQLRKIEGAVVEEYDPYAHVVRTPSPSTNFLFGRTHGLPFGYSLLLWGPPGAGKSLLSNATVGQLHSEDPEAIVVRYDTEFRDEGQMTAETARAYKVDLDRYMPYAVNHPTLVFDNLVDKIGPMLEAGAPIRLVIIDSITGIQGRRESGSSIEQHNIGDHAHTVQIGLKKILPLQRKHKFALIVTAHARAEMDMWEQKRGNKTKAAVSFGVQHHCEYFLNVERDKTKKGRSDELGRDFIDTSHKDLTDSADETGHKIKVWMQKSSVGPANRQGAFTVDYKNGIINQHEEVFNLGVKWGIIGHPTMTTYTINEEKFVGKPACLAALEKKPDLQRLILARLLEAEKGQRIPAVTDEEVVAEEEV